MSIFVLSAHNHTNVTMVYGYEEKFI